MTRRRSREFTIAETSNSNAEIEATVEQRAGIADKR
jgi:hypothetical protein